MDQTNFVSPIFFQGRIRPMLIEQSNGDIWILGGTSDCSEIDILCREQIDIFNPRTNKVSQKRILNLPEVSYGAAVQIS